MKLIGIAVSMVIVLGACAAPRVAGATPARAHSKPTSQVLAAAAEPVPSKTVTAVPAPRVAQDPLLEECLVYSNRFLTMIVDAEESRPGVFVRMNCGIRRAVADEIRFLSEVLDGARIRRQRAMGAEPGKVIEDLEDAFRGLQLSMDELNVRERWAPTNPNIRSPGLELATVARVHARALLACEQGTCAGAMISGGTVAAPPRENSDRRVEDSFGAWLHASRCTPSQDHPKQPDPAVAQLPPERALSPRVLPQNSDAASGTKVDAQSQNAEQHKQEEFTKQDLWELLKNTRWAVDILSKPASDPVGLDFSWLGSAEFSACADAPEVMSGTLDLLGTIELPEVLGLPEALVEEPGLWEGAWELFCAGADWFIDGVLVLIAVAS